MNFWFEAGASPAKEIITALRPSLGQLPNSKLLILSTPFQRSGPMWETYRDKFGQDDPDTLVVAAGTRDMNSTYSEKVIERAMKEDYAAARSEYFAGEFRQDLETFLSVEALEAVTATDLLERPRVDGVRYVAGVDPSGGRGDAMCLSVSSWQDGRAVQDCIRIQRAPFDPSTCVTDFVKTLNYYGIEEVIGDRFSGAWCSSDFEKRGILYRNADLSKSEYYLEFLPIVMRGGCMLLDNKQQIAEFRSLLRRTGRGRDNVDHPPNLHDDASNACAISTVEVFRGGGEEYVDGIVVL